MNKWPHSHGDDPRLAAGTPLAPDELETVGLNDVYVRCYTCRGAGWTHCECGGTGFDWSDTADVRATLAQIVASQDSA